MKIKNPLKGKIIKPKEPVEPKEVALREPVEPKEAAFREPVEPKEATFREPVEPKNMVNYIKPTKPAEPIIREPVEGKIVNATVVECKPSNYIKTSIPVAETKRVEVAATFQPVEANLNSVSVFQSPSDGSNVKRASVIEADEITDIEDIEVTDASDAEEVLYEILSSKLENAKSVPDTLTLDELFAPYVK